MRGKLKNPGLRRCPPPIAQLPVPEVNAQSLRPNSAPKLNNEVNPNMNTLSGLRRRVDALLRKYAPEVAIVRLRRLASEYSLECTVARADRQPQPDTHSFILRVVDAGFRLTTFMAVHKYLESCRSQTTLPDSAKLLRALLPSHIRISPGPVWEHAY